MFQHLSARFGSSRRNLVAVAAIFALSTTALAGCGSSSDEPESPAPTASDIKYPDKKVTVTWIDTENANVQIGATIADFERRYPNIAINYVTVPFSDYETVLGSRLAAGDIDIVTVDQKVGPAYYVRGWTADLTAAFGNELDRLDSASVAGSTYHGKLINAPRQSDTTVLFYNKDILTAAGIPFPPDDPNSSSATWQDLRDNSLKIQAAGKAKWGITWERIASRYYQWPLAESNGAGNGLNPADDLDPEINSDQAVQALQWYGDLYTDGVSPRGSTTAVNTDLFATGQSAYHTGGAWDIEKLNANPDLHYGIAKFPKFGSGGEEASNSGGLALGLYPNSKNKEAALFVINELVFGENGGELTFNREASSPPANNLGKDIFWSLDRFSDPRAARLREYVNAQLDKGIARPVILSPGSSELESIISAALSDITNGSSAREVLNKAESDAKNQFAKYRG